MKRKLRFLCLLALCAALLCGCSISRYSGKFDDGLKAFSAGDWETAADIFERCDPEKDNARVYAAYSRGLVFWEQGQYLEAKPCFEISGSFMYGRDRLRFCTAYQQYRDGDYAAAAEGFSALGDFENAAAYASLCEGLKAEADKDYERALVCYDAAGNAEDAPDLLLNLQTQIYNRAIALKDEGSRGSALVLFGYLGDYLNSAAYAKECRQADKDELYAEAEALESSGDRQGAYRLFTSLSNYRDSAQRAAELAEKLNIKIVDETDPYGDYRNQ